MEKTTWTKGDAVKILVDGEEYAAVILGHLHADVWGVEADDHGSVCYLTVVEDRISSRATPQPAKAP